MSQYQTAIYTRGDTLPTMDGGNFYHSPELFHIVERTPGQRPCMAVATDGQGRVVGHILVFLLRASWMPLLYWQAHAYGEGDYAEDVNSEEVFGLLLEALVRRLRRRLCFFIEFSDISRKMFGYKYFRAQGFFPIPWQEIHNSLHSMDPHDRLQPKMLKKIGHIYQQGVVTREVTTEEDLDRFVHLVRGFYRWKVHRVVPPEKQIAEIYRSDNGRLFATLYKGRLIGGCVCVYSEGNAYLWYLASLRKRYAGLPYPNNPFREFILRFGGKPVAKYRWFRFSIGWLNKLLSWIWKE